MKHRFSFHKWINTSEGLAAVTEDCARLPLPIGPFSREIQLYYGPYLDAISNFLSQNNCQALQTILSRQMHRSVSLAEVSKIDIISEKHGALYHVARLRAELLKEHCSMAINVAVTRQQQAFLENEYGLLAHLSTSAGNQFLPLPYLMGETTYHSDASAPLLLKLLVAEWFDDFHEFHLALDSREVFPVLKVWERVNPGAQLDKQQKYSLYSRAASILTACLDGQSFQQIHPWHHAAGDFIVKLQREAVDLRLITVRDYRCLLPPGPGFENLWAAIVHFFTNMSLRMRLDRLDGVGRLAWAAPDCIEAIIAGFLQSWQRKTQDHPQLPSCSEVLDVLRSFKRSEWLQLAGMVIENDLVEVDEMDFIGPLLADHVTDLSAAFQKEIPDVPYARP